LVILNQSTPDNEPPPSSTIHQPSLQILPQQVPEELTSESTETVQELFKRIIDSASRLLFIIYYLLFIIYYLLFIIYYLLFIIYYFIIYY